MITKEQAILDEIAQIQGEVERTFKNQVGTCLYDIKSAALGVKNAEAALEKTKQALRDLKEPEPQDLQTLIRVKSGQ